MTPVTITLLGEPKGKGRPRFWSGRGVTPPATRSYEAALRYAAQEAMGSRPPLTGALTANVEARMPIPASWSRKKREAALTGTLAAVGKPDPDNIVKSLDALNQVVFVDDRQIVEATVRKYYHEQPALVIRIDEWRAA